MRRSAYFIALPILISGALILAAVLSGPPSLREGSSPPAPSPAQGVTSAGEVPPGGETAPADSLPRLVDLGAGKCIPCKKMAPILEALRTDYSGVVDVVFVDVWKDPKAGKPYKIRVIPTQVFFDANGTEVLRHEGYFSREEIEKVFLEKFGVPSRLPREGAVTPPREG